MEKCPFCATEIPDGASVCVGCQAQKVQPSTTIWGVLSVFLIFPGAILSFFGGVGLPVLGLGILFWIIHCKKFKKLKYHWERKNLR